MSEYDVKDLDCMQLRHRQPFSYYRKEKLPLGAFDTLFMSRICDVTWTTEFRNTRCEYVKHKCEELSIFLLSFFSFWLTDVTYNSILVRFACTLQQVRFSLLSPFAIVSIAIWIPVSGRYNRSLDLFQSITNDWSTGVKLFGILNFLYACFFFCIWRMPSLCICYSFNSSNSYSTLKIRCLKNQMCSWANINNIHIYIYI